MIICYIIIWYIEITCICFNAYMATDVLLHAIATAKTVWIRNCVGTQRDADIKAKESGISSTYIIIVGYSSRNCIYIYICMYVR